MYKFKDGGIIFDNEEELVNLCTGLAVKAARAVVDKYIDSSIKNLKENFDDVKKSLENMEHKLNKEEEKKEEPIEDVEEEDVIHIGSNVGNLETASHLVAELYLLNHRLMVKNIKLKAILEENGLKIEEGE